MINILKNKNKTLLNKISIITEQIKLDLSTTQYLQDHLCINSCNFSTEMTLPIKAIAYFL